MSEENSIEVALTRGKVALVSFEDYELVSKFKWTAYAAGSGLWYAARCVKGDDGKQHTVYMHRLICAVQKGFEVDHINSDSLDNRRANLRIATRSENMRNRRYGKSSGKTSRFKGVSLFKSKTRNGWQAHIGARKHKKNLGFFETEELAHAAYCEAARRIYGEFARTA